MKIIKKIYSWLNADNIHGDMGMSIICYIYRWGILVVLPLLMGFCYLIKLIFT